MTATAIQQEPPAVPRVLIVSPLPPPVGGIASWSEEVLASSVSSRFAVSHFDTGWRERSIRPVSRWHPGRALGAVGQIVRFEQVLRRQRPDIVHLATSYYWGLLRDAIMARRARARGARVLLHLHGGDFIRFMDGLPRVLRRLVFKILISCDRIVVLDDATARALSCRMGSSRIRRLTNGVSVPLHPPPRLRHPQDPVRVLYAGALIEAKGVFDLLAAFRGVSGATLTLVGPIDSETALRLEAMAASDGRVRIVPEEPRLSVLERIAACDVFVLPSHREGLPLSLLEAMAAGRAIVTTPVGGIPEVVRDAVEALLVPPRDVNGLRTAIQSLVDDADARERLGRAAHARALAELSTDVLAERLGRLWGEVLGLHTGNA